jgi:hypothetical protein
LRRSKARDTIFRAALRDNETYYFSSRPRFSSFLLTTDCRCLRIQTFSPALAGVRGVDIERRNWLVGLEKNE